MRTTAIYVALIGLVGVLAGDALADDSWSKPRVLTRAGENTATYTPTTTTGDTQSPTLDTSLCGNGITITAWDTDLTGVVQLCNATYGFGIALDTAQCQDMNLSAINAAASHSVQIIPSPAWIRFISITNSDSAQLFQVACTGSN